MPGLPSLTELRRRCYNARRSGRSAAWLARLLREQEVGGSNPLAPTRRGKGDPILWGGPFFLMAAFQGQKSLTKVDY